MFAPRIISVGVVLGVSVAAQHSVSYFDQPSAGPNGPQFVVVGHRDNDSFSDLVMPVWLPLYPGSSTLGSYAWSFSGASGQVLGQGAGIGALTAAGDRDGDGYRDYLTRAVGTWAPGCAPYQCAGFECRSGYDHSVLWHADVPPQSSLGSMMIGDLDLDGDHRPDALIGTPYGFGTIYAVSADGMHLYTITGTATDRFAPGIGKFVDCNGDGRDDFLLGVYFQPNGGVDIRSGLDGSLIRRLPGPQMIWGFGSTTAMTGDMDGDGQRDVIMGDSGPFTPGVVAVVGSVTGALIHRWQVNQSIDDSFGYPYVGSVDVDRDGFEDVIAFNGAAPYGQHIYSGRDGSMLDLQLVPNGGLGETVAVVGPQAGDPFPHWFARGFAGNVTRTYLFSGAPDGVERTGLGSAGTLSSMPVLGLRELPPSSFRITLTGAEPGAFAILVVGFASPTLPFLDLSNFGFPGSYLYPQPDVVGFFQAGTAWPNAGYVSHDVQRTLVPATTPGAMSAWLQWIVFGSATTWPGGVSEAMRIHFL